VRPFDCGLSQQRGPEQRPYGTAPRRRNSSSTTSRPKPWRSQADTRRRGPGCRPSGRWRLLARMAPSPPWTMGVRRPPALRACHVPRACATPAHAHGWWPSASRIGDPSASLSDYGVGGWPGLEHEVGRREKANHLPVFPSSFEPLRQFGPPPGPASLLCPSQAQGGSRCCRDWLLHAGRSARRSRS
jgi:hypothetical protein